MPDKDSDTNLAILSELKTMSFLLRLLVRAQLGPILETHVAGKMEQVVYEMTGDKPVTDISAAANISTGKISQLWSRWEHLGIVYKDGKSYRRTLDS